MRARDPRHANPSRHSVPGMAISAQLRHAAVSAQGAGLLAQDLNSTGLRTTVLDRPGPRPLHQASHPVRPAAIGIVIAA